jgi:hypothetical protein
MMKWRGKLPSELPQYNAALDRRRLMRYAGRLSNRVAGAQTRQNAVYLLHVQAAERIVHLYNTKRNNSPNMAVDGISGVNTFGGDVAACVPF